MAIVFWTGNGITTAQVDTITITAVAVGGTLTFTINGKAATYTCGSGDTTATAATFLFNLLSATAAAPPEFNEITWANPSAGVITATSTTPGTPFTLTTSSAGGATLSQVHTTTNASPSDVNADANWLRAGSPAKPQNGDDVIVADSTVPMLWNLDQLASVQFKTFTRWQSFTVTIGLPEINPNGYYEYRPTYFQFTGPPAGTLVMVLGQGSTGSGPSRERYNVGSQTTTVVVLNSGSPSDDYAIRLLGGDLTVSLSNTTLALAMLPAETATLTAATVDGGGTLTLGPGVTTSAAIHVTAGSLELACTATGAITLYQGSTLLAGSQAGGSTGNITAYNSSTISWLSSASIPTLTLRFGSIFDISQSLQAVTITNSAMDSDCQVIDTNNVLTFTNATTVTGAVTGGPFQFGSGRTVKWA